MTTKIIKKYIAVLIIFTFFTGCSEYKKLGEGFVGRYGYGYEDKQISANKYKVSYKHDYMPNRLAHQRADEICNKKGFETHYTIEDDYSSSYMSTIVMICTTKQERDKKINQRMLISCNNSESWVKSVKSQKIALGMPVKCVIESWGKPERINTSSSIYAGSTEQWIYGDQYLYFRNGTLESFQGRK